MKIGILTHSLKNNYGGLLQNYALQTVLKRMGHEVHTIDRLKRTPISVKISSVLKRILRKISGENVKLRAWTTKKEDAIISTNTRGFVENKIVTTRKVYNAEDLKNIHSEYGFNVYVVGSDQVWRRNSQGNASEFLAFIPYDNKILKIAYSASFGIDNWVFTDKETKQYSHLAKQFDSISVREKSGIELCKKYLDVKAVLMPDPTLLLNKEDYFDLIHSANIKQSEGNLFAYILDRNNKKSDILTKISEELSLKPFEVMPEQDFMMELTKDHTFNINKCMFPEVEKWLRAFMDAEFVITDSFHGTVFAIIFNKPFISIHNSKRGTTRFQSLLSLFNLEERLITDKDEFNMQLVHESIDFNKIEEKIELMKNEAHDFLKTTLK